MQVRPSMKMLLGQRGGVWPASNGEDVAQSFSGGGINVLSTKTLALLSSLKMPDAKGLASF
ncbi:hypothetical protein Csa_007255 [Cucumis sativus]|uniref:Uncharacterized protein n=1 Tax=Cucumis sativus TaxID=3659 RepID=A0A0A0M2U8_CUCSA|nr:hypothetical protein Csa_007255 [Cucumis sativus]